MENLTGTGTRCSFDGGLGAGKNGEWRWGFVHRSEACFADNLQNKQKIERGKRGRAAGRSSVISAWSQPEKWNSRRGPLRLMFWWVSGCVGCFRWRTVEGGLAKESGGVGMVGRSLKLMLVWDLELVFGCRLEVFSGCVGWKTEGVLGLGLVA
ncbi:hypothetical protein AABB24_011588 [Solanum stoloniferum]|uniref:Uncharacterized protein n=1 Tax=Solanum stoloniferum TaxID=62892 RepID=A0ABD2UEY6_9SOLN